MAAGTTNRNASVELYMWWAGHKGIVFEALILGQIVYDQRRVVLIIKIGLEGELPRQPNSMVADALVFWKYRSAPLQGIMLELGLSSDEGCCTCGFGEDIDISTIEEGYQTSMGIQTEGAQLSKSSQCLVVCRFGWVRRRCRGR